MLRICFAELENKCHMHWQYYGTITNSYDEKEASAIQNRYLTSYLNCRVDKTVSVIHVCQHITQIWNADDKPNTLR